MGCRKGLSQSGNELVSGGCGLALDLKNKFIRRLVSVPLFYSYLSKPAIVLSGHDSVEQSVPAGLDWMEQFWGTFYSTCFMWR